ncbi:hypothetical protein D3C77_567830 [compost metagenome]
MMKEMEVKFKTVIHKEHLYFISSEINLVLKAVDGGMEMISSFDTIIKLSKHNEISEIVIPQEALDSAK